jgi:hypothetical protein
MIAGIAARSWPAGSARRIAAQMKLVRVPPPRRRTSMPIADRSSGRSRSCPGSSLRCVPVAPGRSHRARGTADQSVRIGQHAPSVRRRNHNPSSEAYSHRQSVRAAVAAPLTPLSCFTSGSRAPTGRVIASDYQALGSNALPGHRQETSTHGHGQSPGSRGLSIAFLVSGERNASTRCVRDYMAGRS